MSLDSLFELTITHARATTLSQGAVISVLHDLILAARTGRGRTNWLKLRKRGHRYLLLSNLPKPIWPEMFGREFT